MSHLTKKLRRVCAPSALKSSKNRKKNRKRARTARRFESLEARQVLSASPLSAASVEDNIVYASSEPWIFDESTISHLEIEHTESLALDSGAITLSFTANETGRRQALLSKDHSGLQEGGHITAWVVDGRVEVRLQSDTRSVLLTSAEDSIQAGQQHELAISFGENGVRLFVDGLIADAQVLFEQGIAPNDNSLVIGAGTTTRDGERDNFKQFFEGVIEDFVIYDAELSLTDAALIAGLDLARAESKEMVDGVMTGTDQGELLVGSNVHGGYGDDLIEGTSDDDQLIGGHGEDILMGRGGNDLLISRSDGREPVIAQDYDSGDDPRGEVDPETKTLYSDQPIASDDMLFGGSGADTFRFEILINAKENILFKHVNEDGTIDWQGVTGENNLVHDHWVDRIGNEVIMDFNREEGDEIEFVGHTVDVYKVKHIDSDGDGVLDASVIYVQSNQGNAGAHNKDQLGTVTVYGDLVREGDYTVNAHANLGIVETIGELGEALAPYYGTETDPDEESRWLQQEVAEVALPFAASFSVGQPLEFNGEKEDYFEIAHADVFALDSGTIALEFSTEDTSGRQTLYSKDHTGYQNGGHITVWTVDGRVELRLQSDAESVTLRSESGVILPGMEHHVAVTFGETGARLFVDGELVDAEMQFKQGIATNDNSLVLGASVVARDGDRINLRDPLEGEISSFTVYDWGLRRSEVAMIAGEREAPAAPNAGTTGTGLDSLVNLILTDSGLQSRIPEEEIVAGARAADEMNALIVEAIVDTGVANDGDIDHWDIYDINQHLQENEGDAWAQLHGLDAEGVETGFHLVRGDGAQTRLFGDDYAVNTVADGIYHLGFEIDRGRLLSEEGDRSASLRDVAFWLNELLEEDLKSGSLINEELLPDEAFAEFG